MTAPIPKSVATYGDYVQWDEGRWELLDGEVVDMSPAPTTSHQRILLALASMLHEHFEGSSCEVFVAPFDVLLPEGDEADDEVRTVVQPDLSVVCDASKLDERGCRGAPDWVLEILSPSTAGKDQIRKRRLYERHGVREYWLVHPTDRVVTMYRRGEDGRFTPSEIQETEGEASPALFPDLAIDWRRVFANVPPPPPSG